MAYFGSKDARAAIVAEVSRRVLEEKLAACAKSKGLTLEIIINDALWQEQERLHSAPDSAEHRNQKKFWGRISHSFHQVDENGRRAILGEIIRSYAEEIHGSFNPTLHNLVARIVPWFLKLLLSRISPTNLLKNLGNRLSLEENLTVSGPIDQIRKLSNHATLIMVPTHVSNLDSIVIGLGLHRMGLPPFTYGAGLNLFSNPLIAYFMNNLGAYKVDRRKKNDLYKTTLKHYAAHSMERGEHNLFFPGGTRNRRGDIERHLKLGLLGCGVQVYARNIIAKNPKPDLFVIPATLSYGLVLEAKSLIEEHLKSEGRGRFIRIKSDFSRPMRMLRFWRNLQSLNSRIHLRFGEPLDLFGNRVDENGVSHDSQGRIVDRTKFLMTKGAIAQSPQRDQQYTRELGSAISASFLRNNTAMATHVVAFAHYSLLEKNHPGWDLFRLIRATGQEHGLARKELRDEVEELILTLKKMAEVGLICLEKTIAEGTADHVLETALTHFSTYHDGDVIRIEGERIWSELHRHHDRC